MNAENITESCVDDAPETWKQVIEWEEEMRREIPGHMLAYSVAFTALDTPFTWVRYYREGMKREWVRSQCIEVVLREYPDAERITVRPWREHLAREAFNGGNQPLYEYICEQHGYDLDGQHYPANGCTLAECIEWVAALPEDELSRLA